MKLLHSELAHVKKKIFFKFLRYYQNRFVWYGTRWVELENLIIFTCLLKICIMWRKIAYFCFGWRLGLTYIWSEVELCQILREWGKVVTPRPGPRWAKHIFAPFRPHVPFENYPGFSKIIFLRVVIVGNHRPKNSKSLNFQLTPGRLRPHFRV